jgi:hypothetical protein
MLAAHLGEVHRSVHQAELRKAELPRPTAPQTGSYCRPSPSAAWPPSSAN